MDVLNGARRFPVALSLLVTALVGAVALAMFARPGSTPVTPTAARPADEVAALQARLRAEPGDAAGWARLGTVYLGRARLSADPAFYGKAEGALNRSQRLVPDGNVAALVGLGMLANARHDFARARDLGERARRLNPHHAETFGVLNDAYTQLGDRPAARAALQRMLDLAPGTASFARASYHFELSGDPGRADSALRRALTDAATPDDEAFCLYRLGDLAWNTGRPAVALGLYERALKAVPETLGALAGRARALAALGRTEEALAGYRRLVARAPLPDHVLEYGEFLQSRGDRAGARAQYRLLETEHRFLAASGVNDDLTIGRYEADHGDPRKAVAMLRAEWNRRKFTQVADLLGWALHRAGHDTQAARFARIAARPGGRDALAAYHRGEIERSLGRDAAGLRTALKINPYFSPLWAPRARTAISRDRR